MAPSTDLRASPAAQADPIPGIGLVAGRKAEDAMVVRPVGTWVVAGFLVFAILTMWVLVSVIFVARS